MVKRWQEADGLHLDLQGLSPPEPMIEILHEIDGGASGPLIVHMDRDPIPLYPELEDRGWSGRLIEERQDIEADSPGKGAPVILELRPDTTP